MTRTINRIEFRPDEASDAFVVFEGHENRPFWNRKGFGPCYVFTDLTFEKAKRFEANGVVRRSVFQTTEAEYESYEKQAAYNHENWEQVNRKADERGDAA